jgi:hypothetical protein
MREGNRSERRGARVEALTQLGLDPVERRLVGRPESGAFEAVAGQTDGTAAARPTPTLRRMSDTIEHRIHGCYSQIDWT